jgi:Asp/Glu/hydantoin racemase
MLGRRFGVVCFTRALVPMYEDCLARRGLAARCAGFRAGPGFTGDPGTVAEEREAMVAALVDEAVRLDGADVVIIAGGPLAGLARSLGPRAPVPLIDGVAAAVGLAEALVRLAPILPRREAGLAVGLAPGLSALFQ